MVSFMGSHTFRCLSASWASSYATSIQYSISPPSICSAILGFATMASNMTFPFTERKVVKMAPRVSYLKAFMSPVISPCKKVVASGPRIERTRRVVRWVTQPPEPSSWLNYILESIRMITLQCLPGCIGIIGFLILENPRIL